MIYKDNGTFEENINSKIFLYFSIESIKQFLFLLQLSQMNEYWFLTYMTKMVSYSLFIVDSNFQKTFISICLLIIS